jgi:hypothetical protein
LRRGDLADAGGDGQERGEGGRRRWGCMEKARVWESGLRPRGSVGDAGLAAGRRWSGLAPRRLGRGTGRPALEGLAALRLGWGAGRPARCSVRGVGRPATGAELLPGELVDKTSLRSWGSRLRLDLAPLSTELEGERPTKWPGQGARGWAGQGPRGYAQ